MDDERDARRPRPRSAVRPRRRRWARRVRRARRRPRPPRPRRPRPARPAAARPAPRARPSGASGDQQPRAADRHPDRGADAERRHRPARAASRRPARCRRRSRPPSRRATAVAGVRALFWAYSDRCSSATSAYPTKPGAKAASPRASTVGATPPGAPSTTTRATGPAAAPMTAAAPAITTSITRAVPRRRRPIGVAVTSLPGRGQARERARGERHGGDRPRHGEDGPGQVVEHDRAVGPVRVGQPQRPRRSRCPGCRRRAPRRSPSPGSSTPRRAGSVASGAAGCRSGRRDQQGEQQRGDAERGSDRQDELVAARQCRQRSVSRRTATAPNDDVRRDHHQAGDQRADRAGRGTADAPADADQDHGDAVQQHLRHEDREHPRADRDLARRPSSPGGRCRRAACINGS